MRKYAKRTIAITLLLAFSLLSVQQSTARMQTGIIELIRLAVVKAIKAIDLKIQRMQNKTIWLQNAQKTLENTLSKLKLKEIAEWNEKHKEQYRKYYDELTKVKSIITYYQRVKDITQKQLRLVNEYNRVWQILRQDSHFSVDELSYMKKVYEGILRQSMKNVDQISGLLTSLSMQMSDAKRLELINDAADQVDQNYDDLNRFNQENIGLTIQRARSQQEMETLKKLYGIH